MEKRIECLEKRIPAPWPTPIHKPRMTSLVWNISIGQLGVAAWLCSLELPHTSSLAQHERLEKVLDFLATTENTSLTKILLVLNPKHSSYWEEN